MRKLAAPQDDYLRTALRLPRDLHERVRLAARDAGRTMNAEIIARIAAADEVASFAELRRENAEIKALLLEVLAAVEMRK